jgi:O-antigen/teichoic acid export membrane protein
VLSPWIAVVLNNPIFEELLRILSLVIIINSFSIVPKALLRRTLSFKQIAIANITAYIIAAGVAITMAKMGYGLWSIIALHITNSAISTLLLALFAHWRPSATFSSISLKALFGYGGYILISDMLSNICFHIQSTLVGRYFSPYVAGQYAQAKKMEEVASITLPNAMVQVLFPLFSEMQDNNDTLLSSLRLSNKITAFIIFPILTLLIIIAEPIILFLFGSNWAGAIHYFQVLCIGGYFGALQYFTYFAVAATGQSKALFYAGIIKSIFLLGAIFVTAHISMEAVLLAMVLSNVVNYLTNGVIAAKHVGYKMLRQMGDVAPILLISLLIGAITLGVDHLWNIHWALLSLIYLLLYLAIATLSHNEIVSLVLAKCRR